MKFDFYDICINLNDFNHLNINDSYSSKKLLNSINRITKINGKYAELKMKEKYEFKSEKENKSLLSLLYFQEGLFTDFTFEQYKYKNIMDTTQMYYSKNQCVSYDPSKLFINLSSSNLIEIHIWDKVFNYPELDIEIDIKKIDNIHRIIYIDFIDYEWINSLIYKEKINIFDIIKKELNNHDNYSIKQDENKIEKGYLIYFDKYPLLQRKKYNELQKYKINDLIEMITTCKNKYPYKIISNYLQYDLCRWIKEEMNEEKNIEKTIFFKFMKFFLETLGNDFKKIYLFDEQLQINYTEIEIISTYKKKGTFTSLICLNKCKINDNKLNIGDLYLCSSIEVPVLNDNFIAIYIDFIL